MNFPKLTAWVTLLFFTTMATAQVKVSHQLFDELNTSDLSIAIPTIFNEDISNSISFTEDLLIARRIDIFDNNEFIFRDSIAYQYDENENQITANTLKWDGISWNNYFKVLSEYDDNGNNTLQHGLQYTNGEWIYSSEIYNEYDNQDNITLSRTRKWSNNMWNDDSQTNFKYDQNNQLIEKLYIQPINGEWYNAGRELISYYNTGEISEQTFEIWLGDEWVLRDVTTFLYDANSYLIEKELSRWIMPYLKPHKKTSYEYDNLQNLITILEQEVIDGDYKNISKRDFTYNSQNIINRAIYSIWAEFDLISDNWLFTDSFDYSFDDRENSIYYIHKKWSMPNSTWENTSQGFNYYQLSTSIEELSSEQLKFIVSPNPSSGNFNLNFNLSHISESHMKIYSIDGRLLHHTALGKDPKSTFINLSHLNKGEYIISIISNEGIASQKIIIAR